MGRFGRFVDLRTIQARMDRKDARIADEQAHRTFFKADLTTRADEKDADARAILSARAAAYRVVERRDGLVCRVCGQRVHKGVLSRSKLEHHHLDGRGGLARETPANICVLCRACHEDVHVRRVLSIRGDANDRLECERDGQIWTA